MDGSTQGETDVELDGQKVLDIIESCYPNPISIREICSTTRSQEDQVRYFVDELAAQKKISSLDGDLFTRTHAQQNGDTKIQVVKQMPKVVGSKQPVIAIITAQYCEKLAVDAMISNKDTYVRYKNEGETSNYVYTLGNIGDYQVVSTKLPAVGNSRNALIAAGNTTTRLLGAFQQLEYIFLVGCSGGVVNYTDFSSHVRLGDVVVSSPNDNQNQNQQQQSHPYIYVHCEDPSLVSKDHPNNKTTNTANISSNDQNDTSSAPDDNRESHQDPDKCQYRVWCPASLQLQQLAKRLWYEGLECESKRSWEAYIDEGMAILKNEDVEVSRPARETDKLHMSLGVKDVIEVNHPEANQGEVDLRKMDRPMCHFGPIGSSRLAIKNENLRQSMISKFGIRAFDSEFDAVVESIHGNRKDSYIFIRGISDYRDGRKKKDWQQYSALVAAAFMKSLIINLSSQSNSYDDDNLFI